MGVTKKSVPQRTPVKITKKKKNTKKREELICKKFGVNGNFVGFTGIFPLKERFAA